MIRTAASTFLLEVLLPVTSSGRVTESKVGALVIFSFLQFVPLVQQRNCSMKLTKEAWSHLNMVPVVQPRKFPGNLVCAPAPKASITSFMGACALVLLWRKLGQTLMVAMWSSTFSVSLLASLEASFVKDIILKAPVCQIFSAPFYATNALHARL